LEITQSLSLEELSLEEKEYEECHGLTSPSSFNIIALLFRHLDALCPKLKHLKHFCFTFLFLENWV